MCLNMSWEYWLIYDVVDYRPFLVLISDSFFSCYVTMSITLKLCSYSFFFIHCNLSIKLQFLNFFFLNYMFSFPLPFFFSLESLFMVNLHARMLLWLSALLKQVARMYPKCIQFFEILLNFWFLSVISSVSYMLGVLY